MTLDLNTNIDNQRAGYRLHRLEVYNWGTFNDAVWQLEPGGKNSLLTGDIGSGKSTMVDAVTTLLVSTRKVTYNKAAGAESRERSLKSYFLGAYSNERVDGSAKARDKSLRDKAEHLSVLIANFRNEGTGADFALAQVLYQGANSISRVYLTAERALSVAEDFSRFGGDLKKLRRRLRADARIHDHKSFAAYQNAFMRHFGIERPEALDLFYQTVSMKQVGNLTEFVRERMLGQTNIEKEISRLTDGFDNLRAAHGAVTKARDQLAQLGPMIEAGDEVQKRTRKLAELRAALDELPRYFAYRNLTETRKGLESIGRQWANYQAELATTEKLLADRQQAQSNLRAKLEGNNVYQRLQTLRAEITRTQTELTRRQTRAAAYATTLRNLGELGDDDLAAPTDAEAFTNQRQTLESALHAATEKQRSLQTDMQDAHVELTELRRERDRLGDELASLRQRRTAIPSSNLRTRQIILRETGLSEKDLPFTGELLAVRDEASAWEGAIERVLRGLGLSLLVNDAHYAAVSEAVNGSNLKGRLVYLRTLPHRGRDKAELLPNNLIDKVSIKGDSEHYEWIDRELRLRYDYECCDTLRDFQQSARGLTRAGLVKSSRLRHEKDDRHRVDDRSRYILGWTNEAKIAALEREMKNIGRRILPREQAQRELQSAIDRQDRRRGLVNDLLRGYEDFTGIDYTSSSLRLQALRDQEAELSSQNQEADELRQRIDELVRELKATEKTRTGLLFSGGSLVNKLRNHVKRGRELLRTLGAPLVDVFISDEDPNVAEVVAAFLTEKVTAHAPCALLQKLLAKVDEQSPNAEAELGKQIGGGDGMISREQDRRAAAERRVVRYMSDFRSSFPDEAQRVDAELEALPDYRRLHEKLRGDELPRFEERFRKMMRQETIRNVIGLQTKLKDNQRDIQEKIALINGHLRDIDYNEGSYITITSEPVRDEAIRNFRGQLKKIISGSVSGGADIYDEQKFLQVKQLLDRFAGNNEADKRWTRRVTDVRQWSEFGADERGRDDDKSREFFSDSSGKSGGQKEKLAYTILASAIAFQFGLKVGRGTDRSFRFVMIDEAFGKGSDDSTRYALRLFERLNLQLLIVTPLQKINVIEDYVSSVHFVDNPGGMNSRVRNISIGQYRAEREAFRKATSSAP